MDGLRRALYSQALVWALVGAALAALPKFLLVTVFDQTPYADYAFVRVAGLQAVGLAMLMVLVAHRAEDLWWWSWAFVVPTVTVAAVALLNAGFGLDEGSSALFWWVFGGVTAAFSAWLLLVLYRVAGRTPLP